MRLGKYLHIILSVCISLVLTAVTVVSVNSIYTQDRTNISHHILTRLQATSGLIEQWQQNYLFGVRSIAEDPSLVELVEKLINHSISHEDAGLKMDKWLRPIYLGRGYEGHSIITPDFKIILSSSPAFTGKYTTSEISREAMRDAFANGTGLSRPIEAMYPVRVLNSSVDPGILIQLGCAQIKNQSEVIAVLCLRQDPYRNFFAMLATGFSGTSGEAYAVDRKGYIISPTRFGNSIFRPNSLQSDASTYIKELQARVPYKTKTGTYITDAKTNPLTASVAQAMKTGESGYLEGYRDYRNIPVVGAVTWIPGMDVGIVVEQDVDEVYRPFQYSRNAIIGLASLAIILINTLVIALARSRRSLAEREQRMRAFLNNLPGVAHMRDCKGNFLIANKQTEEFYGISRKDIIGQNHSHLPLPRKYIEQLVVGHDEVLNTGLVVKSIKDVTDIHYRDVEWVRTIRFPVFDVDGKSIYAVGTIMLDITEQTHNAQELEKIRVNLEKMVAQRTAQFEAAKLEAEQATRVKSDFLANMSHEIRTPMNAIIGLSHLATLVSDDPKLRNYLQRIHQSSSHLLSIINDILDFSKIEAGKMTIERADFSLEDMLENVANLLWENANTKGLELLLHIDTTLPDQLIGDALRIGQILINFTSNAIKFTETGNVILSAKKINETETTVTLHLEVQDTGIGIPKEKFDNLFQPFYQLDTSSTRRFEGTGLGLTICKNLVELMGGQLGINSEQGKGSTFTMELTLEKAHSQPPSKALNILSHKKRVLVIDDNERARHILAYMLRSLEFEVSHVNSGESALTMLIDEATQAKPFDIVFIDWNMPDMSGIETAVKIKELSLANNPNLVLVAPHSESNINSAAEKTLDAILNKPATLTALYETLSNVLKNSFTKTENNLQIDINAYQNLMGARVLLVEDNEINQDVVKELLGIIGVEVLVASNGVVALECVNQQEFDIVLMDVQMPIMDGFEATRQIRTQERFANLPIIAMTANALSNDRQRCLNVGMNDYISKPISPEALFGTLLRWLNKSTQRATNIRTPATSNLLEEHIFSKLNKLAELDVTPALERLLNNKSFYIKIVERFINERSDIANTIELAIRNNDSEEAIREAHTLKSLAATIGASELHNIALDIEIKLKQDEDVAILLAQLYEQMQSFISKATKCLAG